MLIKLDLEKAYDQLSWNFFHDTMVKVGLPPSWQRNIMHCIETVKLSIIWNGKNLEWFKPTRGIRLLGNKHNTEYFSLVDLTCYESIKMQPRKII